MTNAVVVDPDVVSYLLKKHPSPFSTSSISRIELQ